MIKYTEKQIKELAKMGVIVDKYGNNMSKETSLERAIRIKEGEKSNQSLSKAKPLVTTLRYGGDKPSTGRSYKRAKVYRDGLNSLSNQERMEKGLVTEKVDGIVYTLLDDNTKVCRCCQNRKPAIFFSFASSTKDGKMPVCKDCDSLRSRIYRKEKGIK